VLVDDGESRDRLGWRTTAGAIGGCAGWHLDERHAVRVRDQQQIGEALLLEGRDVRQHAADERGPIAVAGALDDGRIVRQQPRLVPHVVERRRDELARPRSGWPSPPGRSARRRIPRRRPRRRSRASRGRRASGASDARIGL
jgi:hypothetical protein